MSKKETDTSPSKKKIIKKRNTTLEGFLSQFIIKIPEYLENDIDVDVDVVDDSDTCLMSY